MELTQRDPQITGSEYRTQAPSRVCDTAGDFRISHPVLVSRETTEVQAAWSPNFSKSYYMTAENQVETNDIQDLQKDVFKLDSLVSRVDQIEAKCQRVHLLEKQLEAEQEMRMSLEQKVLELQEQLQDSKNKYQETIGWVDDLEDKLRQEQQQQKAYTRKVTELNEKVKTLEKEYSQRYAQIAEEARQRCHHLEEQVRELANEDKSQVTSMKDLSSILENRTMEEALHQAAAIGDVYTVRLLISHGANVHNRLEDETTLDDPTPLHAAAAGGHESTVFALLEASANVNARAYTSATPLICAARRGSGAICQLLIKFGADVNFRDSKNMTALHYACSQGSFTLAQLLIRNGASLSVRANNKTPADVAEANGHKHLAKYIRSKMT